MPLACPICDPTPLTAVHADDVDIQNCAGCGGLWFEAGQLELFPGRPSTERFRKAAGHAPNRCRKGGHAVGRALARCAACGGLPALCPHCHERLSMVPTPVCAVDVCTKCGGVWLDAGEFELLENMLPPMPTEAPKAKPSRSGWEIPAASATSGATDAWQAPGQAQPLVPRVGTAGRPFVCNHCGSSLAVYEAFAYDGESYCAGCRPHGSVSGRELPPDLLTPGRPVHSTFGMWEDVLAPVARFWSFWRIRRGL